MAFTGIPEKKKVVVEPTNDVVDAAKLLKELREEAIAEKKLKANFAKWDKDIDKLPKPPTT